MQSTSPWSIMRARVGLPPISPSYAMSVSVTSLQEVSGYKYSLVDMQRSGIGSATACSRNERDTVAPCQVRSLSIYMPAIHAIGWQKLCELAFSSICHDCLVHDPPQRKPPGCAPVRHLASVLSLCVVTCSPDGNDALAAGAFAPVELRLFTFGPSLGDISVGSSACMLGSCRTLVGCPSLYREYSEYAIRD